MEIINNNNNPAVFRSGDWRRAVAKSSVRARTRIKYIKKKVL